MPKNKLLADIVLEEMFEHLVGDTSFEEECQGRYDIGVRLIQTQGLVLEDSDSRFILRYGSMEGHGYDFSGEIGSFPIKISHEKELYEKELGNISRESLISHGGNSRYRWYIIKVPEPPEPPIAA